MEERQSSSSSSVVVGRKRRRRTGQDRRTHTTTNYSQVEGGNPEEEMRGKELADWSLVPELQKMERGWAGGTNEKRPKAV